MILGCLLTGQRVLVGNLGLVKALVRQRNALVRFAHVDRVIVKQGRIHFRGVDFHELEQLLLIRCPHDRCGIAVNGYSLNLSRDNAHIGRCAENIALSKISHAVVDVAKNKSACLKIRRYYGVCVRVAVK